MSNPTKLTEIPIIETVRLCLRRITLDDADDVFEYAQDPDVTAFVLWHSHRTKTNSIDFIRLADEQFLQGSSIIFGIEIKKEKKLIGTIDIRNLQSVNNCREIGYVISKNYWNRGIATETVKAVIKFGFEQLRLNRIEAHCEEENIGSWRVMEKSGMKYEGTLRERVFVKDKHRSMKMYSILIKEYPCGL